MTSKHRKATAKQREDGNVSVAGRPGWNGGRQAPRAPAEAMFAAAVQHHQAGRLSDAETLYWSILKLRPDHAGALHHLGVIARRMGHADAAVTLIGKALQTSPGDAGMLVNLGNALADCGRLAEAERAYRRAIKRSPALAEAHFALGNVLQHQNLPDEAQASYRAALARQPAYKDALINLGNAHRSSRHFAEAAVCYRMVLAIQPDFAEVHANLGSTLREVGDITAARTACLRALALQPGSAQAHNNLGIIEGDRGDPVAATAAFRAALSLRNDFAKAFGNLGNLCQGQERLAEAVRYYRCAIAVEPGAAEIYGNLGVVRQRQGRLEEAVASYRRSLALRPEQPEVHSNLIFTLDFDPACDLATHQAERRLWNERHAQPLAQYAVPHTNSPVPDRRLRVGYVSADFRRHSAAYAFSPVLLGHDRNRFDVLCYAQSTAEDAMTQRLRDAATVWRPIHGLPDDAVAERIRADGIDVLVDLSGHSAGNRLLVFARKPAPVQVSAWGHVTGTGMPAIDYLLAHPALVLADERDLFSETIVDLPALFPYQPPDDTPPVTTPPLLLRNGVVTFGCLNRLAKVSAEVLGLWARLLLAVPRSRLLLKDVALDDPLERRRIHNTMASYGIAADRLVLLGATSHTEHLQTYAQVDIALDPFPQSGGISTMEALWMGVPVVALRGQTLPGRVSVSLLEAAGLGHWTAATPQQYLEKALGLLANLPDLVRTRASLRPRIAASPMGDLKGYTATVERVYRAMWRYWCDSR